MERLRTPSGNVEIARVVLKDALDKNIYRKFPQSPGEPEKVAGSVVFHATDDAGFVSMV
ncbi:hypothetical protein [Bradyrhizobium neotropicale]|uniref:hypothetical protein n=1 Tax=Bradyrhizobium neotropicale TaxID=1497615 RepID=UPI001AD605C5|nr:hypothetical protein [Bradyrhizobium neotropicale]MBO4227674.1 hypothetical protein [Bradyrhizobium neotropicale]